MIEPEHLKNLIPLRCNDYIDKAYGKTYNINMTTVSATYARSNLYDLIEEVSSSGKRVGITNKGETKAVLISQDELDSWLVTMETVSDPELMKAIRRGDRAIRAGKYTSLEEVAKELGLLDDVPSQLIKSRPKRSKKTR